MKASLNLTQLAEKLTARQQAKHDTIETAAPTQNAPGLRVVMDDTLPPTIDSRGKETPYTLTRSAPMPSGLAIIDNNGHQSTLTNHAAGQLAEYNKIPRTYVRRMIEDAPDLAEQNFNHWLRRKSANDKRMLRTMRVDDTSVCRAVLSNSYKIIDNDVIAETALQAIDRASVDVDFKSLQIHDDKLFMDFVLPKLETEIAVGDAVQFGLRVTNSEIGSGTFSVSPFCYRLVCLNGMVVAQSLKEYSIRKIHKGARVDEITSGRTKRAEQVALLSGMVDIFDDMLSHDSQIQKAVTAMQTAAQSHTVQSASETIEKASKLFAFSDSEGQSILERFLRGDEGVKNLENQWSLANAVTNLANDDKTEFGRATELHEIGGRVLDLNPKQWERLAIAA